MSYIVKQIKPNVYHIADPMGVFMTLIVGQEKAMLFDTGYGIGHLNETLSHITDLPLIVINSHGHLDHILGNRFFSSVYLHPADNQIYQLHSTEERKRSIAGMQKSNPEIFPKDFSPETYMSVTNTELKPVVEGDVFDLGGVKLTVFHSPGHTPGGIALLDDRDRLLLAGDSVSPHVWMLLPESTSMETYIQSLKKLHKLSAQYDGIVASHVPEILPNDLIDRLIHCAEHIDPAKSVPYDPPFDDIEKGIMYFEGFESLRNGLGMETLDLTKQPFYTLNLSAIDFSKVMFVSIVYNESKI